MAVWLFVQSVESVSDEIGRLIWRSGLCQGILISQGLNTAEQLILRYKLTFCGLDPRIVRRKICSDITIYNCNNKQIYAQHVVRLKVSLAVNWFHTIFNGIPFLFWRVEVVSEGVLILNHGG